MTEASRGAAFWSDDADITGTTEVEIAAPAETVIELLSKPDIYWHVLPRVHELRVLDARGTDHVLEVVHAVGPFRGGYVLRVRTERDPAGGALIRFWVDPHLPRDVESAHGYFQIQPIGPATTRLTYGIRINLEPGIVRLLFTDRIRRAALGAPYRARDYVDRAR